MTKSLPEFVKSPVRISRHARSLGGKKIASYFPNRYYTTNSISFLYPYRTSEVKKRAESITKRLKKAVHNESYESLNLATKPYPPYNVYVPYKKFSKLPYETQMLLYHGAFDPKTQQPLSFQMIAPHKKVLDMQHRPRKFQLNAKNEKHIGNMSLSLPTIKNEVQNLSSIIL